MIGTVSDGDIRRGLLRGLALDSSISTIVHQNALVAPLEMGRNTVLQLMAANDIQQVPVVDDQQQLIGLHLWNEVATTPERFTRKKHDAGFPHHAIRYCLKEAGIPASQIDNVVFYEKPFVKFERLLETYLAFAPKGFKSFAQAIPL